MSLTLWKSTCIFCILPHYNFSKGKNPLFNKNVQTRIVFEEFTFLAFSKKLSNCLQERIVHQKSKMANWQVKPSKLPFFFFIREANYARSFAKSDFNGFAHIYSDPSLHLEVLIYKT